MLFSFSERGRRSTDADLDLQDRGQQVTTDTKRGETAIPILSITRQEIVTLTNVLERIPSASMLGEYRPRPTYSDYYY